MNGRALSSIPTPIPTLALAFAFACAAPLPACRHAPPAPSAPAASTAPSATAGAEEASTATTADASAPDSAAESPAIVIAVDDAGPTGSAEQDPALLGLADQTAQRVAALRGLSLVQPVRRGVMDRGHIVARLRSKVTEEYPPGEVELEGEAMKRLGLIPEGMDYQGAVFSLLEEQVAGFYDPDAQQLFIAAWVGGSMQAMTMSHEITHALQDQHFHIAHFTHHLRGGGDVQTAGMSVLEGDATLTMLEDMFSRVGRSVRDANAPTGRDVVGGGASEPRLAAAPRALRELLVFPYRAGYDLCQRAYRAGGFPAIDALIQTPPVSTEQVMHPDKLAQREAPVAVEATVPAPLAADYVLAYDDVEGELGLQLFLETALDDAAAAEGAAGWGGDRAVLLLPRASGAVVHGGDAGVELPPGAAAQGALVWTVVFDTEQDARQFEQGAGRVIAQRYPGGTARALRGVSRAVETSHAQVAAVARAGRAVVVLDRAPMDRAGATALAALGAVAAGGGR